MRSSRMVGTAGATALVLLFAGCATWGEMERSEKGTAVGATGGALAGAAVGGPVGAVVGAGAGAYVGHHQGQAQENTRQAGTVNTATPAQNAGLVRSVQQALNNKGYDAGPADGQWGPSTESALRQFQHAYGISQTGNLDSQTLNALGVSR